MTMHKTLMGAAIAGTLLISGTAVAQQMQERGDRTVAVVLAVGLAPADQSVRGLDANEHEILAPSGMDRQALHLLDLQHVMRPCLGPILLSI